MSYKQKAAGRKARPALQRSAPMAVPENSRCWSACGSTPAPLRGEVLWPTATAFGGVGTLTNPTTTRAPPGAASSVHDHRERDARQMSPRWGSTPSRCEFSYPRLRSVAMGQRTPPAWRACTCPIRSSLVTSLHGSTWKLILLIGVPLGSASGPVCWLFNSQRGEGDYHEDAGGTTLPPCVLRPKAWREPRAPVRTWRRHGSSLRSLPDYWMGSHLSLSVIGT